MNDFSPCCVKRIDELTREGLEETKKENAKGGPPCEIIVNGRCRVCGTWLSFNHVYWAWEGELDLGTVSVDWPDRDSVVRPD
jgi:hypothetical protein